uniref:PQQ-dependent sugar dehydrogenase n=1 Tax=Parerythrobacter lutipelagi TaxID=1964208 RepID=UPI0010F98D6D|nr:sorbosone dehydrogenase family protein [Parerythrobacter lutipelagi]
MSKFRKFLIALLVFILAFSLLAWWLFQGDEADLPVDDVTGTKPVLSKESAETIPTINIAEPIGWKDGEKPEAAKGLRVERFADGLEHPRVLYSLPNGDILVTLTRAPETDGGGLTAWIAKKLMSSAGAGGASPDQLVLLRDADGDGVAESRSVLTDNLASPSGIAWTDGTLYVANHDALVSFPYELGATKIAAEPKKLMDLPPGENHWMRNIALDPDGESIYIAVGSASNIGEKGMAIEEGRAAIHEYTIASGSSRIYGAGLRNPNGLDWNPWNGELWTTVNERDMLGSDLVPDYLTNVPVGVHYGWPWLYWKSNIDRRVDSPIPTYVSSYTRKPEYALGPHVAALGLAFTKGGHRMGASFGQGAFIARHGSWNRIPASGYDVVFVAFDERGNPLAKPVPVLSGFLTGDGKTHGRPTWVAWAQDGALLVSDDTGGIIWRVIAPGAEPAPAVVRYESGSLPPQRELIGDPSAAFREDFAREVPMPMPVN